MNGLFGSTALEIALGLIFIYFLLSLVCSAINEFFAGLLKWRARDLENGIVNLLRDPSKAKELLSHPLIKAVGSDKYEAVVIRALAGVVDPEREQREQARSTNAAGGAGGGGGVDVATAGTVGAAPVDRMVPLGRDKRGVVKNYGSKPSYIPSDIFSLVLLDLLAPAKEGPVTVKRVRETAQRWAAGEGGGEGGAALQALGKSLLLLIDNSKGGQTIIGLDDMRNLAQDLPESPEKQVVIDALNGAASIDEIRTLTLRLPLNLRQPLLDLLNRAQSDLDAVRTRFEGWYDTTMEQVRGVYKRRIQIYLFGFGLLVASIIGADTFHLASTLATNANLRQALTGEVGRATTPGGDLYLPVQSQVSSANTITSTTTVITGTNATSTTTTVTLPSTTAVVDTLDRYSQLFGYDLFGQQWSANNDFTRNTGLLLWKVLGLLVTAFAVSFGAPFWFDLLNKVANLRAAIKPEPDKSKK
jgi:hypothetical protein